MNPRIFTAGLLLLLGLIGSPGAAAATSATASQQPAPALAVYDSTMQVTSADLFDDDGLLAILKDRPLTRDDVREAIRQRVFWRKIVALAYEQYSKPTFRAEIKGTRARLEYISKLVVERDVDPHVPEIAGASVEAYFKAHTAELVSATRYRFQHMLRLSRNAPSEAEAKIREAYARLLAKQPFEAVAKSYSEGSDNPGAMAEESASLLPPRLAKQLDRLKPRETSAPFQTEMGWAIVKLNDRIDARPMTLAEARADIIQHLRDLERQRLLGELVVQLDKKYRVERRFDRIPENMVMGPNMILFSIDGKDYDWRSIQELFLFTDRTTTLLFSRGTTARPLMEQLLVWRLLERHAQEQGYLKDPSVEAVYRNAVAKSLSANAVYRDAVDQTLVESAWDLEKIRRMQKNYKPTDDVLYQYYVAHQRDKYWMPPTLDFQFLYIPYMLNPATDARENARHKEEAREKMRQAEARAAKGEDFGALVREYSQHSSGLLHISDAITMFDRVQVEQYLDHPAEDHPSFEWQNGLAKVRILNASRGAPFSFESVKSQVKNLDLYEETEARVRQEIRREIIDQSGIAFQDNAIVAFVREMNRKYRSRTD